MKKKSGIPSLSFSLERALGITKFKQKVSREKGIPFTRGGIERKIGNTILKMLFGNKKSD